MSEFIKISARAINNPGSSPTSFGSKATDHYINVRDVVEIDSIGRVEVGYDEHDQKKFSDMVCIHHRLIDIHGGRQESHRVFYVEGTLDEWAETLNAAIADAHARDALAAHNAILEADHPHRLTDRGEWTGDETYVPLDYVTKPGTTETFLCTAENKSSSAGVLANTSFWCPITLPD